MKEFDKIVEKGEKIFWDGKPQFWPFVIASAPTVFFGLVFLVFLLPAIIILAELGLILFVLPHIIIVILFVLIFPLYQILVHRYTHYAITSKRILFQRGIIGRDFEIIDFDKVTNAEVEVGVIDKIFGKNSGTIRVSTAGSFTYTKRGAVQRPYTLQHIEDPYNIFKFFKKVSHDVKTDINYPNKYRPKTNPGYNTKYKPKNTKKK